MEVPTGSAAARLCVALCIVTLRRPQGLQEVLAGIGALEVDPADVDLTIVVVDNDAEGSARAVVDAATARLPYPVHYDIEPVRGIAQARNRAVRNAGAVDLIGFIDDDEVPEPDWLRALLVAQRRWHADVVIGPSVPRFEPSAPRWVVKGGFFDRVRFVTGQVIPPHFARTSGVLIRRNVLPSIDPFDERLGLMGGEDVDFFERLAATGKAIIWVDEARVVESVPATRTTARWLLARQYRTASVRSVCLMTFDRPPARRVVKRVGAAVVAVLVGLWLTLVGVFDGRPGVVRGLQRVAYGVGLAAGLVGLRYEEYRVVHGR